MARVLILAAALLAGAPVAAQAVITEYPIPPGFPHDPAVDRDNIVWYTAQQGNRIGRLDPVTGQVTQFAIPTANSGPHGLDIDRQGHIWFTENSAGKIGRLDPATGQITEYPMPDATVRDPHTPVFDQKGILWFTAQIANRVGRLDPATGEIRLFTVPTPNARPYGIRVDANGVPWFVEFGTNKIGKIDPQTFAIEEFTIPQADARPRRLAILSNGDIYFTDYSRGRLGRFRPGAGGGFTLWPSPSGAGSQPYGIAADHFDMLWYHESSPGANKLVRFDPRDESFATVTIPTPGPTVRHMEADRMGRIWLAESGIDRIGKVEPAARLTPEGVVNAAGFSRGAIAPGQIVSIFGINLAFDVAQASSLPLPTELRGASLTIGERRAPLFYVSPGQVNAQVPFETPPGNTTVGAVSVPVAATAPGVFVTADGVTAAAIEPVSGQAITAANPARQGTAVTLFASGLGPVTPPMATGAASTGLTQTNQPVTVTVGGSAATVTYSGLAPGFVGLYQINLLLPSGIQPGDAPIVLTAGGVTAKVANLPIR